MDGAIGMGRMGVSWLGGALRWLEGLAGSWLGAVVLFVIALADFVVQAVAWPLVAGKNLNDYLLTYIQLFDRHPLLPWAPLYRGPGAGVVIGPLLSFNGGALAEPVAALLFALSLVAWTSAALLFGRRVAILTACALLLYPGYGGLFHEFASEIVMATAFSLWALAVARAAMRPSAGRFLFAGLGIALLVFIRPGNAILVPFALFPLLLGKHWRQRLIWAAAFTAAACLPLAAWTLQNGWRYGDYTLARGGNTVVPFYRAFAIDRIVSPTNGPASRRLAAAIQQHLLTRNPYKANHVTLAQVFSSGDNRVIASMILLSDQVWGWNSAYSTLSDAAWEGIKAHPATYASGVADTIWQQLSSPSYSSRTPGQHTPQTPPAAVTAGHPPVLDKGELIPFGERSFISRPDQSIREVWTSPTTYKFVFLKPKEKAHFDQITRNLKTLEGRFPQRAGNAWLQLRLNQVAHWYPPPIFWLLLGLVALPIRRPRGAKTLTTLALAGLTVIVFNALGQTAVPRYMLPVAPAFILLAAAALLGQTRRGPSADTVFTFVGVGPRGGHRTRRVRPRPKTPATPESPLNPASPRPTETRRGSS
jgi:hypothetical protein